MNVSNIQREREKNSLLKLLIENIKVRKTFNFSVSYFQPKKMFNLYPNYCYSTYNNNLDLSSSDDTIDLDFASNSFAPFQLSRGYGLIANYGCIQKTI